MCSKALKTDSRRGRRRQTSSNADVVQQVHSDYLRVGADIITSNNFWTTPTRLDSIGERHAWRTYATAAIRNAVEARNAMRQEAYVAGGIAAPSLQGAMSPTSPVSDIRALGPEAYRREWTDHAKLLADEGADLILAEYVGFIEDCVEAVDGCAEAGVPVFLGVRHIQDDGAMQYGESLIDLASALEGHPVDAVLLMCSNPENISVGLPILQEAFAGPVGAYPNLGYNPTGPIAQQADAHEPKTQCWRGHPAERRLLPLPHGGVCRRVEAGGCPNHRRLLRLRAGARCGHVPGH